MIDTAPRNENKHKDPLQSVISDDLFPQMNHISDVKQVIEEMTLKAQNMREEQIKAILLLEKMGSNTYLHPNGSPYKDIIKYIKEKGKEAVASPEYYLDTIEALIPKPPKPIIMTEKGAKR